ncbi:hypothetical protein U27_06392 [Candidatus Vecturithrix granuli]|uniref:Uncharacterized protein n=1 Tax=Vecturithrix granuli TaxID=1499967 RepID=A0A081C4A3_VECG1|nr:hypothetical protein U27_06392 [Candidatus Vecturithrix granuli]
MIVLTAPQVQEPGAGEKRQLMLLTMKDRFQLLVKQ